MQYFHIFSTLVVISAIFGYVNIRFLKLPNTIGLMLVSMIFSILMLTAGKLLNLDIEALKTWLEQFDFSDLLLEGMLSFMLFAGAIHIKMHDLKKERWTIFMLSTFSVTFSTFLVGTAAYYLLHLFGIQVTYLHALLFGSLISPTDPIAVISILKNAGVSKSLEVKIAGESLFNDGVAVVIFVTLLLLSNSTEPLTVSEVATLFAQEAIGGLLLGAVFGWLAFKAMKQIDNYQVEVLITLACVMGGYTAAHFLHVSGPLAMVVAGLIIGNIGKEKAMSDTTAQYIDKFWELIDEVLNAILFVLIGLELLIVKANWQLMVVGAILIVVTLIIRYISVLFPTLLTTRGKGDRYELQVLTWGALRGGISIALALSLTFTMGKDIWVTLTYIIVCFSILVQGLTLGKFAKRAQDKALAREVKKKLVEKE